MLNTPPAGVPELYLHNFCVLLYQKTWRTGRDDASMIIRHANKKDTIYPDNVWTYAEFYKACLNLTLGSGRPKVL